MKYFQGPRYRICLVVKVKMPGGEMKIFEMENFDGDDDIIE